MNQVQIPLHKRIDYIRAPQDSFETYCTLARTYDFRCIFAYEDSVDTACELLNGTDVRIATAIDFPAGILSLAEKLKVFERRIKLGFREVDYVVNQKALEARDYRALREEMGEIAALCRSNGVVDKVIVEMPKLDGDDCAKRAVVEIARDVRPCFLKTSSGRPYRASLADVEIMHEILGDEVAIKAAGGIHTFEEATAFVAAGAQVIGASAAIEIVRGAERGCSCTDVCVR